MSDPSYPDNMGGADTDPRSPTFNPPLIVCDECMSWINPDEDAVTNKQGQWVHPSCNEDINKGVALP